MSLCVRACACVCDREMERERETCAHFEDCSFFLLFFCTSHRERGHFFLLWFPLSNVKKHSKKFSFFLPFFVSFLFFCLFYFLISPIKKIITRRRRKDLFSSSSFFFCVGVFSVSHDKSNTRRGSQNIFAQKRKRPPFFSLDSHKKAPKKKRFSQNVTCSPLSRVSL